MLHSIALTLSQCFYRERFDCDTTEPASVLVVAAERGLSRAPEALLSVRAPVCAGEPD